MKTNSKKHSEELLDLIMKAAGDKKLLQALLSDMLTPSELREVETRWQIVKRLASGEPQRTIAKDLKIGIATVTRGSRELADGSGGFAQMIKKMKLK